ncbi:hypothetical protein [Dictyobacter aurantiacus]|uniref:N-acetyltransferase domain-containing protein n=1 Tax=Dictyobacter aurantiacus TaxID=1936993 RepID=A0A401ZPT2_9CHLR|nr:hypothetical protein [Dictyobacter aurantiacus]GCE08871.1 hypothetical protein KDAU_62000 [Dictyobacter aurantiacus]
MYSDQAHERAVKQTAYLWTWWQGDSAPFFPEIQGWHVETSDDVSMVARLSNISKKSAEARFQMGHLSYLAYLDKNLVSYGWSAVREAEFGSPGVHFRLPPHNLYLYHFMTLLPWRGHGFYPRLIQEVIKRSLADYQRFWIIHQISNQASRNGIARAGFHIANSIVQMAKNGPALLPDDNEERSRAGAELLGLPLLTRR